jgi:hypothetical protein
MIEACSPRLIQEAAPSCAASCVDVILAHFAWLPPSFLTPVRKTDQLTREAGVATTGSSAGSSCLWCLREMRQSS